MAQADNALVTFRDWVAESTLTASSEATVVERVQELRPSRVWRATGDAAEWFAGDVGSEVQINIAGLLAHNFDTSTELRFRAGTDVTVLTDPDNATTLVDETFDAWRPVAGLGYDGFGLSLGGYPILSDFADYRPYSVVQFANASIRYWRWDITRSGGNTYGNFEVGRGLAGLALQAEHNIAFGYEVEWVDPSEVIDTEESVLVVRRRKYRIIRCRWEAVTRVEAETVFDDMKRIVGRSREVLLMIFPTADASRQYRTTVYGVPVVNGPIRSRSTDLYETTLEVREVPK